MQLDDGSTLVYDVLVLAPGLHNATLSAVKDGGVGGVCSAGELYTHLTAADAADLSGVIVYGDTLDAVTAMGTLSAQGVDLSETALHVAPPGPSGPGLDILLEVRHSKFRSICIIRQHCCQDNTTCCDDMCGCMSHKYHHIWDHEKLGRMRNRFLNYRSRQEVLQ